MRELAVPCNINQLQYCTTVLHCFAPFVGVHLVLALSPTRRSSSLTYYVQLVLESSLLQTGTSRQVQIL